MTVIDKILQEWSYRCSDGIVDMNDPEKKAILDEILKEYNIDEAISSHSKKYFQQQKQQQPDQQSEPQVSLDNVEDFSNYIQRRYAVENQTIFGLDNLFKAIQSSSKKDELINLIKNSGGKRLTSGKTSIKDIDSELFNLIMSYIKLDNGDSSELWFAIMFNGKAKGGVATESGIESDVEIGNQGVSVKNYKKIGNIDFGSLPKDELKELKTITNLLVLLTGVEFTAGLTRNSLNNLLKTLGSESFQKDLKQILVIGKDTQIKALKNIYDKVITLLPNGNTEELVDNFVDGVNKLIESKIKKVQWWAIIAGKNDLYLEPSSSIADRLISKEGQLSSIISQIKGNNLFVNGNLLFSNTESEE